MPALHIRDVPESVVAALRERASRHDQSMQQELRQILATAASGSLPVAPPEPIRLATVRTSGGPTWGREEIYDDQSR